MKIDPHIKSPLTSIYFLIKVFVLIISFGFFSCEKVDINPMMSAIDIDLVVLNEDLEEGRTFQEGKDFMLMLKATNNSSVSMELKNFDWCRVLNDDEFSKVFYKTNGTGFFIGNAIPPKGVYCIEINYRFKIPPKGSIFLTGVKWSSNPDNTDLPHGDYFSNYILNFGGREFYTYAEFSIE